jgi:hypothetical protein
MMVSVISPAGRGGVEAMRFFDEVKKELDYDCHGNWR